MRNKQGLGPAGYKRTTIVSTNALVSKEFWDKRHGRVRLKYVTPQPKKYYFDFELDRVFHRWLGYRRGQRLMEAGCGSSLWLPYFAKQFGMEIAGLDYSDIGLARSREILRRNNVQGSLRKADLRKGPGRTARPLMPFFRSASSNISNVPIAFLRSSRSSSDREGSS